MSLKLTGEQRQQFKEALISAFPDPGDLEQMFDRYFDLNLKTIAMGANYTAIVFKLIEWAEAQGRLQELIESASASNPGNPDLCEFLEKLLQAAPIRSRQERVKPLIELIAALPVTGVDLKVTYQRCAPKRDDGSPGAWTYLIGLDEQVQAATEWIVNRLTDAPETDVPFLVQFVERLALQTKDPGDKLRGCMKKL